MIKAVKNCHDKRIIKCLIKLYNKINVHELKILEIIRSKSAKSDDILGSEDTITLDQLPV